MSAASKRPSGRVAAAVTGAGIVAPLGVGVEPFWRAALAGESAVRATPASSLGAPVPARACTLAAAGFAPEDHTDPRVIRRFSRLSTIALIAAEEAARHARLDDSAPELREQSGVALGTAFGSSAYHFEYYEGLFRHGIREASPLLFSESVLNAASGHITHRLGVRGPGLTLVGGEDAGLQAVATALDLVRGGATPLCFAGGAEEYCDILHASLARCGVVGEGTVEGPSHGAGTPYGAEPRAPCLGEGAALLAIEDLEAARARDVEPLALVLGAASRRRSGDEPPSVAVERAVRAALDDAAVEPERVGLVVGGGGGGELDREELEGIAAVFPEGRRLEVSAPKRVAGEGFAFTSALQATFAVLALSGHALPSTCSAGATLRPAAWRAAEGTIDAEVALAVSLTRAGGATAIVLGRVD